jgi:hypothetical protein
MLESSIIWLHWLPTISKTAFCLMELKSLDLLLVLVRQENGLVQNWLTFEKVLSLVKKSKKKYWPKNGLTFLQKIIQMKSLRLIAMLVIFRDFMLVNSPGWKDNGLKIFHPSNLKNEIFKVCFQGKNFFLSYIIHRLML